MSLPLKTEEVKHPHGIFNYLSLFLLLLGIGLFYSLTINIWLKWLIFIISLIAATGLFFFFAPLGINLHGYIRDSWRELQKVVWPNRKETIQFTWIVFLFVLVLALFLWALDSGLAWLLYSVILGKGA